MSLQKPQRPSSLICPPAERRFLVPGSSEVSSALAHTAFGDSGGPREKQTHKIWSL